jgi:hypothetical protein
MSAFSNSRNSHAMAKGQMTSLAKWTRRPVAAVTSLWPASSIPRSQVSVARSCAGSWAICTDSRRATVTKLRPSSWTRLQPCTPAGRTGVCVALGLPSRGQGPHLGCPPSRVNSTPPTHCHVPDGRHNPALLSPQPFLEDSTAPSPTVATAVRRSALRALGQRRAATPGRRRRLRARIVRALGRRPDLRPRPGTGRRQPVNLP